MIDGTKKLALLATLCALSTALSACEPYHGPNHFESNSIGSNMPGVDRGGSNDGLGDNSLRNVAGAAPGGGR